MIAEVGQVDAEVPGEVECGRVVVAEDAPAAGKQFFIELTGLAVLPEGTKVGGEVGRCSDRVAVVVAPTTSPDGEGLLIGSRARSNSPSPTWIRARLVAAKSTSGWSAPRWSFHASYIPAATGSADGTRPGRAGSTPRRTRGSAGRGRRLWPGRWRGCGAAAVTIAATSTDRSRHPAGPRRAGPRRRRGGRTEPSPRPGSADVRRMPQDRVVPGRTGPPGPGTPADRAHHPPLWTVRPGLRRHAR